MNAVTVNIWDKYQRAVNGEARVPVQKEYDMRMCTENQVCFVHATNPNDRDKVRRHVRSAPEHNMALMHVDTFERVRNCTGTGSLSTGHLGVMMALRTCAGPVHLYGFLGECCQNKMPWLPNMNYKYFHTEASKWVCCHQGRENTLPMMKLLLDLEREGALKLHLSEDIKGGLLRPPEAAQAPLRQRAGKGGGKATGKAAGRPLESSPRFARKRAQARALYNASAVYEELYANHGYHANLNFSHGKEIARKILRERPSIGSVLDVGCSHGFSVKVLWKGGVKASGIDLAPTAVALALRARGNDLSKCIGDACFKVGSATDLPFATQSFDAIMSTEVLEHLMPDDVENMVSEFSRVARHALFLKVAGHKEANLASLESMRKSSRFEHVQQLHTTVQNRAFWVERFGMQGWVVDTELRHTEPWERVEISAGNSLLYFVRRGRSSSPQAHHRPTPASSHPFPYRQLERPGALTRLTTGRPQRATARQG